MKENEIPRIPSLEELGIDEDEVAELERGAAQPAAEGDIGPRARSQGESGRRRMVASAEDQKPSRGQGASVAGVSWRTFRGVVTLLVLLLVAWLSRSGAVVPSPVSSNAPDAVFSSGRAMVHVARLAAEARPVGSPAHADARRYLLRELRAMGHDPSVQASVAVLGTSAGATVARVHNIVTRIPGTRPGGRAVLLTAHYDSRGISRGAADDAAGVAAILESLRALGAGPALDNDLIVLLDRWRGDRAAGRARLCRGASVDGRCGHGALP